MKLIDVQVMGNVARFFWGKDDLLEWWGDDWDDAPWEHNAGRVYPEFIEWITDVGWPLDYSLLVPDEQTFGGKATRLELVKSRAVLLAVIPNGAEFFGAVPVPWQRLIVDARVVTFRAGMDINLTTERGVGVVLMSRSQNPQGVMVAGFPFPPAPIPAPLDAAFPPDDPDAF